MKRLVNGPLLLVLLMVLATPVLAEGQGSSGWQQFKQDVKETGLKIGKAGTEAGHGAVKGARKGGDALGQLFSSSGGNKGGKSK